MIVLICATPVTDRELPRRLADPQTLPNEPPQTIETGVPCRHGGSRRVAAAVHAIP
jgi:hypothetical protein